MQVRTSRIVLVLAAFFSLVLLPPVFAQQPIKLGFIYTFSGRLAHYGYGAQQGAKLAIEEINSAGGVNGRKLVDVYGDTQLKPDVGVKAAKKLVNEEKVDVLLGIVSSGVARAVAPEMNRMETPLIITLAMTPDVTGKMCNPYTFRINLNGPQNLKGAANLAATFKVRKWTTLGPDYIYGYQSWEYFQKYLAPLQPGVLFAPKEETAFSATTNEDIKPYIQKVLASGADGVLVTLYGGNLIDFIRQGKELKIFSGKMKLLLCLGYSADVMYGVGLEMPEGLWLSGQYWFQANDSPVNKRFVERYVDKYHIFPDYNAQNAYAGVMTYVAAVKKAGSTDKKAVAAALEGLTLDVPVGTITIRPEDHQAVLDGVWGVTAQYNPKFRCRLLKPLKIFPGLEIIRPVSETGCKLR
ncbi:ABC transporter substrate-binding protein [Thermodesulfobacteriota bacterium]